MFPEMFPKIVRSKLLGQNFFKKMFWRKLLEEMILQPWMSLISFFEKIIEMFEHIYFPKDLIKNCAHKHFEDNLSRGTGFTTTKILDKKCFGRIIEISK